MTEYRISYEGPAEHALGVARMLADTEGVELTSSEPPERRDDPVGTVVLRLTVEGAQEAVTGAVASIRGGLPSEATLTIEDG